MNDRKEIEALIYLLEDTDDEVIEQVQDRLMSLGNDALTVLEEVLYQLEESIQIERVQVLIKKLKFDKNIQYFSIWKQTGAEDLLGAVIEIARIRFPDIERQEIENAIDKIKLDAWLEMHYDLTSYEKVRILNHIFYNVHQFQGDSEDYHNADNSFINKVLERHRGNPISLAIIYSIVAQKLNIPIYGVNLPQHFVLGYKAGDDLEIIKAYNDSSELDQSPGSEILFYINPFSQGLVLSHQSIYEFLKQINVEPRDEYFNACSNIEIIQRILRNLIFTYEKEKNDEMLYVLQNIMQILENN
jgi:regulator of sirC expression with transglutaminase-like and TPR domain